MVSRLLLINGVSLVLLVDNVDHILLESNPVLAPTVVAFSTPQHSLSQVVQKMVGY